MSNRSNKSDKDENRHSPQDEVPNMFQRIWNFLFAGKAAFWTALFTGILTVFTYKMYDVSKNANETTRSSERAFVSFAGFQVGPRMRNQSNDWLGDQIFMNWNNSGTTPAKNLIIQTNAKPWPIGEDLPPSYEFSLGPEKSRGVMAPKGNYQHPRIIPSSTLNDNWHGKIRLFVWGTMLYNDIFPNDPDRLTEFCVEISQITVAKNAIPLAPAVQQTAPKTIPATPTPSAASPDISDLSAAIVGFTYQACPEHNCYDDNCKDYAERVKDMRP